MILSINGYGATGPPQCFTPYDGVKHILCACLLGVTFICNHMTHIRNNTQHDTNVSNKKVIQRPKLR